MIQINNLTKTYHKNIIFQNVDLSLEDGNIYFVLGKNGSGKTTFIKCLLNLEKYQGNITYFPNSSNSIFAIYDDIPLYENLSGYDNLRLFAGSNFYDKQKIDSFKGLSPSLLSKKVSYYSLGERKKLLIMAALLKRPQYLILDEIANGLDIDSLKWLTTHLNNHKKDCLILVTGHYLEFYEKLLDEIIVIDTKNIHKIEKGGLPLYELYEKLC